MLSAHIKSMIVAHPSAIVFLLIRNYFRSQTHTKFFNCSDSTTALKQWNQCWKSKAKIFWQCARSKITGQNKKLKITNDYLTRIKWRKFRIRLSLLSLRKPDCWRQLHHRQIWCKYGISPLWSCHWFKFLCIEQAEREKLNSIDDLYIFNYIWLCLLYKIYMLAPWKIKVQILSVEMDVINIWSTETNILRQEFRIVEPSQKFMDQCENFNGL